MKQKRIQFPTNKHLDKRELFVSISDNVLTDKDYPIARLTLEGDFVVKAELVKSGVYSFVNGPSLGWNRSMILKWLNFDLTGSHPEIYHNLIEWDETLYQIFESLPTDHLSHINLNGPFGLIRAMIDIELDRRQPELPSTKYDHNGNEIKAEVIGFDEKGREIWLEI